MTKNLLNIVKNFLKDKMIKKIKGWETDNHTVTNGCRINYYHSSDLPSFTIGDNRPFINKGENG